MKQENFFKGKVALVTGGARGIGRAYCRGFVERDSHVVIADCDYARAKRAAADFATVNVRILPIETDVASESSVRNMYEEVLRHFGGVNFLINNAALMLDLPRPFKPFWELELDEWNRVMAVNAGGVYLCCKHVKPIMMQQGGGRIVNITSDGIWKGYEGQLAYFASKGAVAVMTRCLARELGPFNINVNAVAPGYTLSEAVLNSEFLQSVRAQIEASYSIKHDQYPDDLIGAVLFLCSPDSRCITGQTIVVNCGSVMP